MDVSVVSSDTYARRALIALESYVGGKSPDDVAEQFQVSRSLVSQCKRQYADQREGMLRAYFLAGGGEEGRSAVVAEFGQAPQPVVAAAAAAGPSPAEVEAQIDHKLVPVREQIAEVERRYETRLQTLETNLATLVKQFAQPAKAEPLPPLTLGMTPPAVNSPAAVAAPDDEQEELGDRSRFPEGDLRRENYRVHVTHQASEQWVRLFGDDRVTKDHNIRRRIIGVFYAGKLAGKGSLWTVTGVNRYSCEGVRLKCVVERDTIYVSSVERCALTDL